MGVVADSISDRFSPVDSGLVESFRACFGEVSETIDESSFLFCEAIAIVVSSFGAP